MRILHCLVSRVVHSYFEVVWVSKIGRELCKLMDEPDHCFQIGPKNGKLSRFDSC